MTVHYEYEYQYIILSGMISDYDMICMRLYYATWHSTVTVLLLTPSVMRMSLQLTYPHEVGLMKMALMKHMHIHSTQCLTHVLYVLLNVMFMIQNFELLRCACVVEDG